jgi:hypothetical protein
MESDFSSGTLGELLASVSGADAGIDHAIAKAFCVDLADFTSNAVTARNLVTQVLPQATLRVGYDVCGVLPRATISFGEDRSSAVAPTVSLAILRALASATAT